LRPVGSAFLQSGRWFNAAPSALEKFLTPITTA
jgi:hypothetical protein